MRQLKITPLNRVEAYYSLEQYEKNKKREEKEEEEILDIIKKIQNGG